jgi:hypothetical protein
MNKTIDQLIAENKAANEIAYTRLKKIADQLAHGKYYQVSDGKNLTYFQFNEIASVSPDELVVKYLQVLGSEYYGEFDRRFYFRIYLKYKLTELTQEAYTDLFFSNEALNIKRKELFEVEKVVKKGKKK